MGKETLKDLCLFFDTKSDIKPLSELVSFSLKTPVWLNSYKVKSEEYFAELDPYLIQEDELFAKIILPNIEIIKDELTEVDEIKGLINFFKDNHRTFFNEYIIQKQIKGFKIIDKSDKHQIIPPKDERKAFIDFIDAQLSDKLIVLSYDFSEFNNEDGIVKGEDLHSQILEYVDVNEHKEILVDILLYRAKHKFILKLSEYRFNSKSAYTKDDYEFKIIELACSELKENDYQNFRKRVVIETERSDFKLSEISLFTDKIEIANREFSLSKILPLTHQNSDLISNLISQFNDLGIPNEKLYILFGVNEELDKDDVFEKFIEQTETLKNPEQFFFLVYFHQENPGSDISKLGFDLNHAVFPSEYALENEKLPEYLQQWINNEEIKLPELEKLG
ncbi:MAG: hypothetical protein KDC52_19905, partial [Ignavibacteriae bacterium]|nr:hypothetical protein [Ignavibacteriota bacterium]